MLWAREWECVTWMMLYSVYTCLQAGDCLCGCVKTNTEIKADKVWHHFLILLQRQSPDPAVHGVQLLHKLQSTTIIDQKTFLYKSKMLVFTVAPFLWDVFRVLGSYISRVRSLSKSAHVNINIILIYCKAHCSSTWETSQWEKGSLHLVFD